MRTTAETAIRRTPSPADLLLGRSRPPRPSALRERQGAVRGSPRREGGAWARARCEHCGLPSIALAPLLGHGQARVPVAVPPRAQQEGDTAATHQERAPRAKTRRRRRARARTQAPLRLGQEVRAAASSLQGWRCQVGALGGFAQAPYSLRGGPGRRGRRGRQGRQGRRGRRGRRGRGHEGRLGAAPPL